MATTATTPPTRPNPPASRRRYTTSSPSPSRAVTSVNRAASTRSTTSPRTSPPRRPPPKQSLPSAHLNGESREALTASLKSETDQKEHLLLQVQNKDQTITQLTSENDHVLSALNAAESRLNELYAEQSRSEAELAQRIDIADKLRVQVRELEREKRDIHRRYNEQTATFEAERQAFYDNEQHLKSRIQSLSQARRQPEPIVAIHTDTDTENDTEDETDFESEANERPETPKQDLNDPETEPAEMTALRLELSTLSTSYASLQSTLMLLQGQLIDLKRVNHELQEDNESYMILLREKTLSGQYDVTRQVRGGATSSDEEEDDDSSSDTGTTDMGSLSSAGRSTLDRVPEEEQEETLEQELERSLHDNEEEKGSPQTSRHGSRHGRKRTSSTGGGTKGESLAGLPITGPGLDLAAELGRAENKDILLNGNIMDDRPPPKAKRARRSTESRKVPISDSGNIETTNDIDALRSEVKSLKDANKALSLYASKIIDRIISQEGYEHVLAADYERQPVTPKPPAEQTPTEPAPPPRRSQAAFMGRAFSTSSSTNTSSNSAALLSPPVANTVKTQRRSLSFDWRSSFSFLSQEKKPEPPTLRPLPLKSGTSPTVPTVTTARKLETEEDEEDRKERERLNATMKLMGIQPPPSPQIVHAPAPQKSLAPSTPLASITRRFSLFGSRTPAESEASSMHSTPSADGRIGLGIQDAPTLTQEALVNAEAENTIAALEAQERTLSAEVAKGAPSGFTEIQRRSSTSGRRSRRSAGGSGSTVWSAGMSDGHDPGH